MAADMTGEGTSYADLVYSVNLNEAQGLESEEYGVGFRKGSDLVDVFNEFWAAAVADAPWRPPPPPTASRTPSFWSNSPTTLHKGRGRSSALCL